MVTKSNSDCGHEWDLKPNYAMEGAPSVVRTCLHCGTEQKRSLNHQWFWHRNSPRAHWAIMERERFCSEWEDVD